MGWKTGRPFIFTTEHREPPAVKLISSRCLKTYCRISPEWHFFKDCLHVFSSHWTQHGAGEPPAIRLLYRLHFAGSEVARMRDMGCIAGGSPAPGRAERMLKEVPFGLIFVLARKLDVVEIFIFPIELKQFAMRTLLDNLSLLQHHDKVGMSNRR